MKVNSGAFAAALTLILLVAGACDTAEDSPRTTPTASPVASGAVGAATATAGPGATTGAGEPGGSIGTPAGDAPDWGAIPELVASTQPSVVSILTGAGEGSGVVWSEDGIIVTNHHVVADVEEVVVAFADGTRARGRVLASDPLSDLAVVQTDRTGLPPATFANDTPPLGTLVIALGNPLGFENTATVGIVSGIGRAIPGAAQSAPALINLIQTDAAISPGNSGGALVDAEGRVIGVNVAYIPPQARAVSIGFAIPSPTVIDVVEQLLDQGTVEHAWLGIQPAPLTPQIAQQFDIEQQSGALVVDLAEGGPAAQAGLEPGDVIIGVAGDPVRTVEDLLAALRRHDVGEEVEVRIVRDGEERVVPVTLGQFPLS